MDKVRVYIVEDDPLIALDMSRVLTDFGYEVVGISESGEDAVKNATALKPQFILMDIRLKGEMDGIEAASKIASSCPAPVVFLTALADEGTLQRAKLVQPYGYLIKPFDPVELHTTIQLTLYRFQNEKHPIEPPPEQPEIEIADGDSDYKLRVLSQLEFFKDISRPELELLAQGASIRSFDAGEFITLEGHEAKAGFIVLSGRVSVTKSAATGKELTVSLLGPGDIYGLFYLLDRFSGSSSARAQPASRVLWIQKSAFSGLQARAPHVFKALSQALAQRLVTSYELASSLAHARVEDRIVSTILTLPPEPSRASQTPNPERRIFITRKELADLTGTTPETAIRITKNLERKGYLDLSRPGIIKIVDVAGLQGMANA